MPPGTDNEQPHPPQSTRARQYYGYLAGIFLALLLATIGGVGLLLTGQQNTVDTLRRQLNSRETQVVALSMTLDGLRRSATAPVRPTPASAENMPCIWQWATQTNDELTQTIQAVVDQRGVSDITIVAMSYGENCLNADASLRYYAIMETDFQVSIRVESVQDEAALAEKITAALAILKDYPPEQTPGPQPGYITFTFHDGNEERLLRAGYIQAMEALARSGAAPALLAALESGS